MIKIAICDDEFEQFVHIEKLLFKYSNLRENYIIDIVSFSSSIELLSYTQKNGSFDLFILDIYMPGMLGTEVAKELRNADDKAEIIFFTTSKDHAIPAFEVDAARYLLKPCSEEKFFEAMDKVMKKIDVSNGKNLIIRTTEGIVRITTEEIIFTETSRNNYQKIHLRNGNTLITRMTARELFKKLTTDKGIVKCGATFSINLKYVRQILKDTVIFDNKKSIHIPYRVFPQLRKDFFNYQMADNYED